MTSTIKLCILIKLFTLLVLIKLNTGFLRVSNLIKKSRVKLLIVYREVIKTDELNNLLSFHIFTDKYFTHYNCIKYELFSDLYSVNVIDQQLLLDSEIMT